jgi:hypothetical protein
VVMWDVGCGSWRMGGSVAVLGVVEVFGRSRGGGDVGVAGHFWTVLALEM